MKFAIIATITAALVTPAFCQDQPAEVTAPPEKPQPTTPDAESIKRAEALMAEVAKAYKSAQALTDTITIELESPMGEQTQTMSIAIGEGESASIDFMGLSFLAVDGRMFVVRDDVDDKYVSLPLEGSLLKTMHTLFGGDDFNPPAFALRSDADLNERLTSLTMGMLRDPKITGHQMVKGENDQELHEIALTGASGKGALRIDPKSKLVQGADVQFRPEGAPAEIEVKAKISMSPAVHDKLPKTIAFDIAERKAVDSLDELEPTPIAKGEAAPDFTLETLSGESVTLSKLQGSVVVLDFWATWCGPCKRGLPKLQEFATWAESSGKPIKVYAVDVWERFKTPEDTKTKVAEFWTTNKYTMPTLLDLDNAAVGKYGFSSIPTTVIVGPDGKVFSIHSGFSEDMVDLLKQEVEEALKSKG